MKSIKNIKKFKISGLSYAAFFAVILAFLCLFSSMQASAADNWVLWSGEIKKGEIPTKTQDRDTFAAVDVMMSSLGIAPTGRTDALIASYMGKKIEFWDGSPAARLNGALATLPYPVTYSGGHWWAEALSAVKIFNQFMVSAGRKGDLRWGGVTQGQGTFSDVKITTPTPSPLPTAAPVAPVLTPAPELKPSTGKRPIVAVDAGHGGHDPGAMANGIKEKDINLIVAKLLAADLRKLGVDARLTRDDDRFLKLAERTALANKWNSDAFVSVHCNALPAGRHAKGFEIYLMALPSDKDAMSLALIENREVGENAAPEAAAAADRRTKLLLQILGDMQQNEKINESTSMAEDIFKAGKASGVNMKRVAQAPFFVLRGAAMPAVLLELGFLTEKDEAAMLKTPSYQAKLSAVTSGGVSTFLRKIGAY